MNAVITKEGNTLKIAPVGRLDTVNSSELREQTDSIGRNGMDIDIDFAEVDYISSAGLRLLVSFQKDAKAEGHTMVVRNVGKAVAEVFRISGFNKSLNIV